MRTWRAAALGFFLLGLFAPALESGRGFVPGIAVMLAGLAATFGFGITILEQCRLPWGLEHSGGLVLFCALTALTMLTGIIGSARRRLGARTWVVAGLCVLSAATAVWLLPAGYGLRTPRMLGWHPRPSLGPIYWGFGVVAMGLAVSLHVAVVQRRDRSWRRAPWLAQVLYLPRSAGRAACSVWTSICVIRRQLIHDRELSDDLRLQLMQLVHLIDANHTQLEDLGIASTNLRAHLLASGPEHAVQTDAELHRIQRALGQAAGSVYR